MDSRPPRAVADLLLTAVPDLRDRLLEHRIRRAWPQVIGPDAARRAQARGFADGCLTVAVDNSPWLHELTLRSEELTRRLRDRFDAVRSLRFVAGTVACDSPSSAAVRPSSALDKRALREIDEAAAAIPDAGVAAAARRLMTKAWPGLTVLTVAIGLTSCASIVQPTVNADDEIHSILSSQGLFTSPGLDGEQRFSYRFEKPGTYEYRCALHPQMKGTVVVR